MSGVRFYKGPQNVGTHIGSLWDSTGTRLGTATFTGESAAGWQTVSFPSAVAVTAGTTYVASYTSSGYYSATVNGLAGSGRHPAAPHGRRRGPLRLRSGLPDQHQQRQLLGRRGVQPGSAGHDPADHQLGRHAGQRHVRHGDLATNESATSRVDYGTTTALGSSATGAAGTSHSVALTGLASGTTYYYRVTSATRPPTRPPTPTRAVRRAASWCRRRRGSCDLGGRRGGQRLHRHRDLDDR